MMKKKFITVLVLLLTMLSFVNSEGRSEKSTNAASANEVMTFSITPWLGVPVPEDAPMVLYWEEMFNVDFDIIYLENGKIAELLPLRISSGESPDIITSLAFDKLYEFAGLGIVGTWTEKFLRDNAPYIAEDLDSLGRSVWEFALSDGEMFGIPFYNPETAPGFPFIWNQTWLNNVGINKIPQTLEEAEAAFYAFTTEDPDQNGADDTYGLSRDGMNAVFGAFGLPQNEWIDDGSGNLVYSLLADDAKKAFTYLAKWYADGIIDPEFITGENKGGYWAISHAFCNGRIGFTTHAANYHWYYPELAEKGLKIFANTELFYQNFPDSRFVFGPTFVGPTGKTNNGVVGLGLLSAVSAEVAENEAKLKKYLEMCETMGGFKEDDGYLTTRFGIEGTHWDYVNGAPKSREGFVSNDELWTIGGMTTFNLAIWGEAFNKMNPVATAWREEVFSDDSMINTIPRIINRPLPSDGIYKSEMQKIIDEAFISIVTGEESIAYFDEMVIKAMEAGGEILTQEANEMYRK